MARSPNGIWSDHDGAIEFRVDPLFWQTLWFRASCIAAFLTLFWGLYRYRVRRMAQVFNLRLEERVDKRMRIARELHDTLLQSFQGSLIQMQAARNTFSRRLSRQVKLSMTLLSWRRVRSAKAGMRFSACVPSLHRRAIWQSY